MVLFIAKKLLYLDLGDIYVNKSGHTRVTDVITVVQLNIYSLFIVFTLF